MASEDYNVRSQERTELLRVIKSQFKDQDFCPAFWACCQVADLSILKRLESRMLRQVNDSSTWIVRQCKYRSKYWLVGILIPCRESNSAKFPRNVVVRALYA
jgi:hypothetical protein